MGVVREVPEVLAPFGLGEHDVDRLAYGGHVCRRHAGAEDKRTGVMLEVVHHGAVAGDEAAEGTERLGEGTHDEVDVVGQAEMAGGSASVFTDDTKGMGIVDQDVGVVLLGETDYLGQRSYVAFHGIDAVDCYEFGRLAYGCPEPALEHFHVVVRELDHLGPAETAAVYYAGMVE